MTLTRMALAGALALGLLVAGPASASTAVDAATETLHYAARHVPDQGERAAETCGSADVARCEERVGAVERGLGALAEPSQSYAADATKSPKAEAKENTSFVQTVIGNWSEWVLRLLPT